MNHTHILSALTAAVLSLASLPVLSVGAASDNAFLPGDIDNDGYLTGHDAALLSRSLLETDFSLTADEMTRADITGDGIADKADALWIFEHQEYALGDILLDGKADPSDAFFIMTSLPMYNATYTFPSELQKNLADVDANRSVSYYDARCTMFMHARESCGLRELDDYKYYCDGTLYTEGDIDGDGALTDHDAVLAANSVTIADTKAFPDEDSYIELGKGDVNHDGVLDQTDADWIHAHIEYAAGDLQQNGTAGDADAAYYALTLYAAQAAGTELVIDENAGNPFRFNGKSVSVSPLHFHLLDANADGMVNADDAALLTASTAVLSVGNSYDSFYRNYLLS